MKRFISFGSVLLLVMVLIGTNVFGAEYFLYDKETNKILFMGKNDSEFSEKIDMEKNPDYLMATDNPDVYLAIFAPENVQKTKKQDQPEPQKGQLIIFDVTTGRTEDLVELGYAPFQWVYSKDRRQFFISYKPAPDSEFLELLHYNIPDKTSAKLENIAKEVSQLILSNDESSLYALVPYNKKKKQPGKILVINPSTLTLTKTIPTNSSPHSIFFLGQDRLAIIEADPINLKSPGTFKIVNSSDYSVIEEKTFPPRYTLFNNWNPKTDTLITIISRANQSYIFKASPNDLVVNEIDSKTLDYKYNAEKNHLYILNPENFRILDYNDNQQSLCFTDINFYDVYPYQIEHVKGSNIAALYTPAGGKLKIIDLTQNSIINKVKYGRPGVKFGNFMSNFMVTLALTIVTNYPYGEYGYYVYAVDLFRTGVNIALDKSKFFVLRAGTRDITVFDGTFESFDFIVPPENPLIMFQTDKLGSQILVVTEKQVYQIISEDLTLKPIIAFNKEAKGCLLLEEENRFVMMTDQELLVIDSANFEIKNRFELFGNPDQEYSRIKEDEQRFYFIPTL